MDVKFENGKIIIMDHLDTQQVLVNYSKIIKLKYINDYIDIRVNEIGFIKFVEEIQNVIKRIYIQSNIMHCLARKLYDIISIDDFKYYYDNPNDSNSIVNILCDFINSGRLLNLSVNSSVPKVIKDRKIIKDILDLHSVQISFDNLYLIGRLYKSEDFYNYIKNGVFKDSLYEIFINNILYNADNLLKFILNVNEKSVLESYIFNGLCDILNNIIADDELIKSIKIDKLTSSISIIFRISFHDRLSDLIKFNDEFNNYLNKKSDIINEYRINLIEMLFTKCLNNCNDGRILRPIFKDLDDNIKNIFILKDLVTNKKLKKYLIENSI